MIIVTLLLTLIVALTLYVGSHRLGGAATAAVLCVAGAGIVLVISPSLATKVATLLGVGRGADLLLYFGFIAALFVCANFYFRLKRQEAQIATLVRTLAVSDPVLPQRRTA
jgi:hypothetical protein